MFTVRPHTAADGLEMAERMILEGLAKQPKGMGVMRPENKYWNRTCDGLIARGFVYDFDGAVAITDAGREQLRANH